MNTQDPIVIVGSARTPIGDLLGAFANLKAPELGATAIKVALERANVAPFEIDEVLMGCVLTAGIGQAPARQAALMAGIPKSVGCTTINKMCGSGMKTVMLAHDSIQVGINNIVVAGGMESMSNAPYLLERARNGYRLGHQIIKDEMLLDGLEDAYDIGKPMGYFAEQTAEKYGISRKEQDEFAHRSLSRAIEANTKRYFFSNAEMTSVHTKLKKGEELVIQEDEHPFRVNINKIPLLPPIFKENGTVTAANSSAISDGAAALVLMRLSEAKKRQLKPLAKILATASFADEPALFTTAPITAIRKLLATLNWDVNTPDLYEINEAFAVVAILAMRELNVSIEKINIHGGACALGHPIGASGARIITTLLGALIHQNKRLGVAAVCIGGGEATAIAIERMET